MLQEIKNNFRSGNIITKLLIANIGVFVIQSILLLCFVIADKKDIFLHFLGYLYFPEKIHDFLRQPWSLFTYMFLHDPLSVLHILFNMAYLFYFGRILKDFLARQNIFPLYVAGGIAGALLFMLLYNVSPAFHTNATLVGASASVLALVAAAATLAPDYTVFLILIGPVKLKYIALVAILVDIVSISEGSNAGGHIAHLGGAITGFLYVKSYQRGNNWFNFTHKFSNKISNMFQRKPKVVFVNNQHEASLKKTSSNQSKQKRTDQILDKIAQSGYESLSKEDKEYLFKISKE